jgi:hypothetical protein
VALVAAYTPRTMAAVKSEPPIPLLKILFI